MSPDLAGTTAPQAETAPADSAPSNRSPGRKMFTRRTARVAMPVEAATRQGRVATLAWEAFGNGEAARAFLNTHDAELGARPIDLATESAAGLTTVEATIAALSGRTA